MVKRGVSFPGPQSLRSSFPSIPPRIQGEGVSSPDRAQLPNALGCFSSQLSETAELQFRVVAAAWAGESLFQPAVDWPWVMQLLGDQVPQLGVGQCPLPALHWVPVEALDEVSVAVSESLIPGHPGTG